MQDRWIFHADLNGCYAAIEGIYNPAIRHLPYVICGDRELRQGIVVAANQIAKLYGITVGEDNINSAKRKCPNLIIKTIRQPLYNKFCSWVLDIYEKYSDYVEPYGPDGDWLDVTNIVKDKYDAQWLADEIRADVEETLGITCSIGVSFNKTISKLASELKKPDATTVITRETFKDIVWKLPPEKLLGIDVKTTKILYAMGITDIGNIAKAPVEVFEDIFGKNGRTLHIYASGEEKSPVKHKNYVEPTNSIGHTSTTYRDMETIDDVKREIYALSERVTSRMRQQHFKCRTIQVVMRGNDLKWCGRQGTLATPTFFTNVMVEKAMEIFHHRYNFTKPLRSLGVIACNLVPDNIGIQSSMFDEHVREEKMEKIVRTMDTLRDMYGNEIIRWANSLEDPKLTYVPPENNRAGYRVGSAFLKDA